MAQEAGGTIVGTVTDPDRGRRVANAKHDHQKCGYKALERTVTGPTADGLYAVPQSCARKLRD